MKYEIVFYTNKRGDSPVDDFFDTLPGKARAKVMAFISLLEEKGPFLKRPYADLLRDGIRELRVQFSPNQYRLLYFFFLRNRIVITSGSTKKTRKVPAGEIEKAILRKKDFINRYKRGEIKL